MTRTSQTAAAVSAHSTARMNVWWSKLIPALTARVSIQFLFQNRQRVSAAGEEHEHGPVGVGHDEGLASDWLRLTDRMRNRWGDSCPCMAAAGTSLAKGEALASVALIPGLSSDPMGSSGTGTTAIAALTLRPVSRPGKSVDSARTTEVSGSQARRKGGDTGRISQHCQCHIAQPQPLVAGMGP